MYIPSAGMPGVTILLSAPILSLRVNENQLVQSLPINSQKGANPLPVCY